MQKYFGDGCKDRKNIKDFNKIPKEFFEGDRYTDGINFICSINNKRCYKKYCVKETKKK